MDTSWLFLAVCIRSYCNANRIGPIVLAYERIRSGVRCQTTSNARQHCRIRPESGSSTRYQHTMQMQCGKEKQWRRD